MQINHVLDMIYSSIDDDEVLQGLPSVIARFIGARSCNLQFVSRELELEEMHMSYFDALMGVAFLAGGFDRYDDWKNKIVGSGVNKTSRYTDHAPISDFASSIFFNEFLRAHGDDSAYCLGFGQRDADGGIAVVGVHNPLSGPDFGRRDVIRLEGIRLAIAQAAQLRRRFDRLSAKSRLISSALDAHSDAVLVLDSSSRIRFANASAEKMIEDGKLCAVKSNRCEIRDHNANSHFLAAIAAACSLKHGGGSSMMLDFVEEPVRIQIAPLSDKAARHALVIFETMPVRGNVKHRLCELYQLTASEFEIAFAIAEGLSAQEIADRIGISVPTVRTHLRHVFEKTDTRRASELSRLVNSLPRLNINQER